MRNNVKFAWKMLLQDLQDHHPKSLWISVKSEVAPVRLYDGGEIDNARKRYLDNQFIYDTEHGRWKDPVAKWLPEVWEILGLFILVVRLAIRQNVKPTVQMFGNYLQGWSICREVIRKMSALATKPTYAILCHDADEDPFWIKLMRVMRKTVRDWQRQRMHGQHLEYRGQ